MTWNELYLRIAKALGKRRKLVHVPTGLARTGARLTQWAPGAPLTTDQIAMIEAGDNVATSIRRRRSPSSSRSSHSKSSSAGLF